MNKAVRLLEMLRLLQERRTVAEMAERLRVSKRTVQRYLLDLQSEPLYTPLVNEDYAYRLERGT